MNSDRLWFNFIQINHFMFSLIVCPAYIKRGLLGDHKDVNFFVHYKVNQRSCSINNS